MRRLLLLGLLLAGPLAAAPVDRPEFDPPIGQVLPALPLRAEDGPALTLAQAAEGHPSVLLLGYHRCPNLCGLAQGQLAATLARTGLPPDGWRALFVSFDPADGPAEAKQARADLARAAGPDTLGSWRFLGGPEGAALARAAGLDLQPRPRVEQFAHPVAVLVLTPEGRVSRALPLLTLEPEDLRLALVEAGEGRVGSLGDQVLLLCSAFDPTTGRYTPVVWRALQAGGLLTALALGAYVVRGMRA